MAMTLKALRTNAGLNQRTAAAKLGVTPETLSSWERGITYPNVIHITKIERLYRVEYDEINFFVDDVALSDSEV